MVLFKYNNLQHLCFELTLATPLYSLEPRPSPSTVGSPEERTYAPLENQLCQVDQPPPTSQLTSDIPQHFYINPVSSSVTPQVC